MNRKRVLFADSALLGITFVWGTTFIVVQNTLAKLPPLSFNAWRFLTAAILLLLWQVFLSKKKKDNVKLFSNQLVVTGFILGIFLFIGYICQTIGLLYTSASNAAFITGLSVVLVPIFSALLLRKRPPIQAIIGIILATCGLFFLTTKGSFSLNRGDLIVFICAVAFALQIVFTEKYTLQFSSLPLTVIQLGTVAILSFIFSGIIDGAKLFDWQTLLMPDVIIVILFMGLVATAAAFLLQTILQKETPATHVGIIYIMEPVFAALTSLAFQHMVLGFSELCGCLLILAGMLLAEWPMNRSRLAAKPAILKKRS